LRIFVDFIELPRVLEEFLLRHVLESVNYDVLDLRLDLVDAMSPAMLLLEERGVGIFKKSARSLALGVINSGCASTLSQKDFFLIGDYGSVFGIYNFFVLQNADRILISFLSFISFFGI